MDPADGTQTSGGGTGERGRPAATGQGACPFRAGPAAAVAVLCLLGIALLLATGTGGATVPHGEAQADDTAGPQFGNITKLNQTAVELEITDNSDVNESSIAPADFALSAGNVSAIEAVENGSDADVTIALEAPIDDGQLHVTIAEEHNVTDEAGNELTTSDTIGRRVYQMDGQAPTVDLFSTDDEGGEIGVRVEADERLEGIAVDLSGPASVSMTRDDFTSPPGFNEYEGTIAPPASGRYNVSLSSVRDAAGNVRQSNRSEFVEVDVTTPSARARIDYANSQGLSVTLDATRSTDNVAVTNVTWDFGDGETGTGERVTHRYEPGNYTVEATVRDGDGNAATDRLLLNLTGDQIVASRANTSGARSVSIDGGGTESPTAIVDVTDAEAGATVAVTRDVGDGSAIVATETVRLQELAISISTNASYRLGIQSEGPSAVADVGQATDGDPLGGLTIVHNIGDAVIENVTFEVKINASAVDDGDGVALFRQSDGQWNRLPTRRLTDTGVGNVTNATTATRRYQATSPGFSRFALVTVPGGAADGSGDGVEASSADGDESEDESDDRPAVRVTAASLNETTVDPGSAVAVAATVANDGDNATNFTAALAVDGTDSETRLVQVPAGGSANVTFTYATDSNGSYALAVNDTTAGTLTVGSTGSGGGLLAGALGLFGFLPLGLLQAVVTYVGGLVAVVFLLLKATALYLGY